MNISARLLIDPCDSKEITNEGESLNYLHALNDPECTLYEFPKNRRIPAQFEKSANIGAVLSPILKCTVNVNTVSVNNSFLTLELEASLDGGVVINQLDVEIPDSVVQCEKQIVMKAK